MINMRRFPTLFLGLILFFGQFIAVRAAPVKQDEPSDPDEVIQVVLVLDVSDSMKHPILSDDLPEELLSLSEQISQIENDPQLQSLNDAIAAALDDPVFVEAENAWSDARSTLDTWLKDNQFGDDLESIRSELNLALFDYGCDPSPQYTLQLAISQILDELDYWIDQACAEAAIGFQEKQALRDKVPYLGNPEYLPLQQTYVETLTARNEALETLNYFELLAQREQFYTESNYELLKGDYGALIADLGIPLKIDMAKLAARTLLDLSRLDQTAGRRVSLVALVIFSTESNLQQELTPNLDAVESKIVQLEPQFQTNIYAGLNDALDELTRNGDPQSGTVVILLSDGQANVGPGPDQILAEIPLRANEMDASICTVGIGPTEAHVDRSLLRGLADETGGEYLFAEKAEELVNFFIACRQDVVGEVDQIAGYVVPGVASPVDTVEMPPETCEFSMALNFPSGRPRLEILDPLGMPVELGYDNFSVQLGDNLSLYTLLNPLPGEWSLTVNSNDSGLDEVFYNIVMTTNSCPQTPTPDVSPTPRPTRTPMPEASLVEQATPIIPVAALVILVMGIFIIITLRRN
jgi:hypothetical protein